jgi:hypothetical protein
LTVVVSVGVKEEEVIVEGATVGDTCWALTTSRAERSSRATVVARSKIEERNIMMMLMVMMMLLLLLLCDTSVQE